MKPLAEIASLYSREISEKNVKTIYSVEEDVISKSKEISMDLKQSVSPIGNIRSMPEYFTIIGNVLNPACTILPLEIMYSNTPRRKPRIFSLPKIS